jgi:hypothetical protein
VTDNALAIVSVQPGTHCFVPTSSKALVSSPTVALYVAVSESVPGVFDVVVIVHLPALSVVHVDGIGGVGVAVPVVINCTSASAMGWNPMPSPWSPSTSTVNVCC